MSLQLDSLVTDLMFQANAAIDQKTLIEGLGGEPALESKQLLDVDRLDPRAEMELSPSMPFRRRGERRLMIIDDKAIPQRQRSAGRSGPRDGSASREGDADRDLPGVCRCGSAGCSCSAAGATPWLVARSVRDLRGICLLPWALDPQVDLDGKAWRATPLSQKEFEAKLVILREAVSEKKPTSNRSSRGCPGVSFEQSRRARRRRRARSGRRMGSAQVADDGSSSSARGIRSR